MGTVAHVIVPATQESEVGRLFEASLSHTEALSRKAEGIVHGRAIALVCEKPWY
jgi:hypothetical protein